MLMGKLKFENVLNENYETAFFNNGCNIIL